MSLINKIQGTTQAGTSGSRTVFTKEEIEFLLVMLRDSTFKGAQLEIMYNTVLKLQEEYTKVNQ